MDGILKRVHKQGALDKKVSSQVKKQLNRFLSTTFESFNKTKQQSANNSPDKSIRGANDSQTSLLSRLIFQGVTPSAPPRGPSNMSQNTISGPSQQARSPSAEKQTKKDYFAAKGAEDLAFVKDFKAKLEK